MSCRKTHPGLPAGPPPRQPRRRRCRQRIPSSLARRLANSTASALSTSSTRSTIERSRVSGMNPAPMPWILCGPGLRGSWPASFWVMTGLSFGSTATERIFSLHGLLDVAGNTGNGPARPDARHQHIDASVRVVPDLRSGGLFVDVRVGGVLELLGQEVSLRVGGRHGLRPAHGAFHPLRPRGEHEVCAEGGQDPASLDAHRLGHGERQFVAPGGGHDRPGRCPCCRWSAPRSPLRA